MSKREKNDKPRVISRAVSVRVKRNPQSGEYAGSLAQCWTERGDGKPCNWVAFDTDHDTVVSLARGHSHG